MRTIRHSLAWKEWHEHKWKLAAITAVLWSVVAFVVLFALWDRYVLGVIQFTVLSSIVPMAVFVGASAAAGERSQRTLAFLQALPVPLWRVALLKLVFGLLSLVVPLLLTLVFVIACCMLLELAGVDTRAIEVSSESFLLKDWTIDTVLAGSLLAGSLFVWCAAIGTNRKDEISAGAVALAVILAWWLFLSICWSVLLSGSTSADTARLRATGIGSAYGGLVYLPALSPESIDSLVFGLLSALFTHGLLATWYVRRFGRAENSDVRSPRAAQLGHESTGWLPPPRRWPVTAIAWKQFRETGTVAFAGAVGVVAVYILFVLIELQNETFHPQRRRGVDPDLLASIAVAFGFGIALVAGIGVFLFELRPGLNGFWRSRPINVHLWFWVKYVMALLLVLTVAYLPVAISAGVLRSTGAIDARGLYIIAILAAQMAVFAAAAAMGCLVRNAVYAAILSVAFLYLGMVLVWLALVIAVQRAGWAIELPSNPTDMSASQMAIAMLINFVFGTLLAWLAVRFDWGRKSRY